MSINEYDDDDDDGKVTTHVCTDVGEVGGCKRDGTWHVVTG